jgi:acyl-ACP thioesterase
MPQEPGDTRIDELIATPRRGRVFEHELLPGLADATGSGRVRLDAIARWLQDVAFADLVDAGLAGHGAWVVRRSRIRVETFPRFGERVRLSTFCSGWGRLAAERQTTVSGDAAMVESVSVWVHLDPASRRPSRLGPEFESVYGTSAGGRKAAFRLRHPSPPSTAARSEWRFRVSDVDVAGHVNNAAYWAPVEELLPEGAEPPGADVEVEFREPAAPGGAVLLRDGDRMWVADGREAVHASILGLRSLVSG